MNKIINIKTSKAIKEIREFKNTLYAPCDVEFINIHLKQLNELVNVKLFSKNDLFINSGSLYNLMNPQGKNKSHHYHDLTPEDIFYSFNLVTNPLAVFSVKLGRIAVVPSYISSVGKPLIIIIEKDAPLMENQLAKINKIVTIYPKGNFEKYLKRIEEKDLLYKK